MIQNSILTGWNFMRALRLGFGIIILIQAFQQHNIMFGILGLLFSGMAVFNIGCCGSAGCATTTKTNNQSTKDISYEEISSTK
ncbi:MAG: hypothetical protein ABL929_09395 [Ferruginibacter sp.]|nr:hypothetical protein [Ferruginibacter sp.]